MQQVLVLNASYEPLNVCSVRRAHVLVWKGKAEVIEDLDRPLRAASSTFRWPHVIRLLTYVRVPRESSWENVVTACAPCNLRKGDRLLAESGLSLTRQPKAPAPELFIRLSTPSIPARWIQYLPHASAAAA